MTMDYSIVNYPLPGNDTSSGGRIFIYGLKTDSKTVVDSVSPTITNDPEEEKGRKIHKVSPGVAVSQQIQQPTLVKVLFFCGGFPDHWTTFKPLAQRLCAADECSSNKNINNYKNNRNDASSTTSSGTTINNIICGVTCLPGYDTLHQKNFKSGGYTFDEMVISLQSACKVLLSTVHDTYSTSQPNQQFSIQLTGIFHDWGSYVGAMVVNRSNQVTPYYFHNVVYFDVLPPAHPKLRIPREKNNLSKSLVLMSYTSLFATCHTIQRYLSYWLAAPIVMIGYSLLFIAGLLPIQWIDNKTFMSDRPKEYTLRKFIYMQYPYFELWRGMLYQGRRQFLKTTMSDATLPENISSVNNGTPILYMYGTKKNAMFHDENVLAWIKQESSSSLVVQVENAGHWLYRQQEDVCYDAICNFIGIS